MPPPSAHQCHINATYHFLPVHINATYQCPSELPFSVSATYQCQSVLPISAISASSSVPITAALLAHISEGEKSLIYKIL
ncbi:unnamed protein product [Staurois parvus]|uniref:Uncharacterized protein n=1 Tax=Staurois parvus TaxID=386267 RepID=A0ABN9HK73_9NEOB|nr:unnamed protein product [Staurois parvus]